MTKEERHAHWRDIIENQRISGMTIAAPMPDHPVAKCKADVGFLAHLIVSKLADHLPSTRTRRYVATLKMGV